MTGEQRMLCFMTDITGGWIPSVSSGEYWNEKIDWCYWQSKNCLGDMPVVFLKTLLKYRESSYPTNVAISLILQLGLEINNFLALSIRS